MEEKILDSKGNEQTIDSVFFVGKKIFKIPNDPRTVPNNHSDIFHILNNKYINPKDLEMMMSVINLIKAKTKSYLLPYFSAWKSKINKDPNNSKNVYSKNLANHKSLLDNLRKNNEKNRNKSNDSNNSKINSRKNEITNNNNNNILTNNDFKNNKKNNNGDPTDARNNKDLKGNKAVANQDPNNLNQKKDKPAVDNVFAKNLELINSLIKKSNVKDKNAANEDTEDLNRLGNKLQTTATPTKNNFSSSTNKNNPQNTSYVDKYPDASRNNMNNPSPIRNNPNNLNFMEIPSLNNQRFDLDDDFIPQEEHDIAEQSDEEMQNNLKDKLDSTPVIKVNVLKSSWRNKNRGNPGAELDDAIENFNLKDKRNQKKKQNVSNDEVQSGINSDEELNDFYNQDASYYNEENPSNINKKNKILTSHVPFNKNPKNNPYNNTTNANLFNTNSYKNKEKSKYKNPKNSNSNNDSNVNAGIDDSFNDEPKNEEDQTPLASKEISPTKGLRSDSNPRQTSNDSRILQMEKVQSIGFEEVTENPMKEEYNNNFLVMLPKARGGRNNNKKLRSQHISSLSISGVNQSIGDIASKNAAKPSENSSIVKNQACIFSPDLDNKNYLDHQVSNKNNNNQNQINHEVEGKLNIDDNKNKFTFRDLNNDSNDTNNTNNYYKYPDINNTNNNNQNDEIEKNSYLNKDKKDEFPTDADNQKILISIGDLKKLKSTMLKIGARMSLIVRKIESKSLKNVFDKLKKNENLPCKAEPFFRSHSKNNSLKSINVINPDVSNRIFSNENSFVILAANGNKAISPINNSRLINSQNNNNNNNNGDNPNLINKGNQDLNNQDNNKPKYPLNNGFNKNNYNYQLNNDNNNNNSLINNAYLMDQIPSDYENENFVTEENNITNEKANEHNTNYTANKKSLDNHSNYLNTNNSANETNNQNTHENNDTDFNRSKQEKSNLNVTNKNPSNSKNKILIQENTSLPDNYKQNYNNNNNKTDYNDNEIPDKNNDPEFLKFVITELNSAMDKLLNKINSLNKEIANKNKIIANHAQNMQVLKERNKMQDEIKTELELLNKNIKSLDNPLNLGNSNFERNLNLINDRYKNLNLKIEIVKLHEHLANKEIIINDLKLIVELSKDEIALLENSINKHLKEKEILASSLKSKDKENSYKFNYFPDKANLNTKIQSLNKLNKNKEKELQQQMDDKLKQLLPTKESELASKFKEKEFMIREDCSRQVYEINKILQEKILQNEKLIFEMEILKSKLHNKELDEREKLEELKEKIFLLKAENEKLLLTNKMNNEIIAQLEAKSYSNLGNNLTEKERIIDTNPCAGNPNNISSSSFKSPFNKQTQFFKNEMLIVDLKSQISKLENSLEAKDKLIESLKDKIKAYSNDNLRKEYELKHNLFEVKSKELNEFYSKLQSLENEKKNLLEENEGLKSNLNKALGRIKELEDLIANKYEGFESALEKEKAEKAASENKLKEISQFYKDNHEILLEEASDLRELINRKEQEMEKMKAFYEKRIQQLKSNIDEMEHFRKNIIDELAGKKQKEDRFQLNHSQNPTEENKYNTANLHDEFIPERSTTHSNNNAKSQSRNFFSNNLSSSLNSYPNPNSKGYKYLFKDAFNSKLKATRDDLSQSSKKEKAYKPYFITENILSDRRQPEKKIKLNMNFNITPAIDSKQDRVLKNSIRNVDYNYNMINNNYMN